MKLVFENIDLPDGAGYGTPAMPNGVGTAHRPVPSSGPRGFTPGAQANAPAMRPAAPGPIASSQGISTMNPPSGGTQVPGNFGAIPGGAIPSSGFMRPSPPIGGTGTGIRPQAGAQPSVGARPQGPSMGATLPGSGPTTQGSGIRAPGHPLVRPGMQSGQQSLQQTGINSQGSGPTMMRPSIGQPGAPTYAPQTPKSPSHVGAPSFGVPGAQPPTASFGVPGATSGGQSPLRPGAPGAPPLAGPGSGLARSGGFESTSMSQVMDAFESLNLGPGGPSVPGGQPSPGANAAMFPRPAGTKEQQDTAVGATKPYDPGNCKDNFVRLTTQAAPNSQALMSRWQLPYGAIVHPLAEDGGDVLVANPGGSSIVRCKRCRTYMNPWMTWSDGGRRFTCNVCATVNETPVDYFCALDASGKRIDTDQRPELRSGSVEYIAPAEYMVRGPMPPTYVFLIDVSFAAASSGMLNSACQAIKACLKSLPGEDRTRIAIMTFDSSIQFYSFRPGASGPQMIVMGEIDEPFIPLPDELLVNLSENIDQIESLMDSIPSSFSRNQRADSAMGPALQAAFLVMNHIGGKLMLFQSAAPSLGIGKIKARDNPALYGTDREYALRTPDDPFYKRFSAEASRFQICIDIFACGSAYQDLPSLGALSRYTGGQIYYYPGFAADKDGVKLQAEVKRNLTRETTWEAVMRIRCSKGLRISAFHGHFFVRSTDLLALPTCDADKSFAVEISHEETVLTNQVAYLQAALLYTSSQGERRIRVHTLAMPVVNDILDLFKSSDCGATAALLAKISVDRSLSAKLDDVRAAAQNRVISALREYRMLHMRGPPGTGPSPSSLILPERLKSLPLLVLGVLKTASLRGSGRDVNTDERAAVGHQITASSVPDILRLIYPSCYRVDNLSGNWGKEVLDSKGRQTIELPPTVPAGLEYFDPSGAHLIDNGRLMILWIGANVQSSFYSAAFGSTANPNDPSTLHAEPERQGSELSARLNKIIQFLRKGKDLYQECHVVRQGSPLEAHVMPYFVEDRAGAGAGGLPGYLDWMLGLQKAVMAKQ